MLLIKSSVPSNRLINGRALTSFHRKAAEFRHVSQVSVLKLVSADINVLQQKERYIFLNLPILLLDRYLVTFIRCNIPPSCGYNSKCIQSLPSKCAKYKINVKIIHVNKFIRSLFLGPCINFFRCQIICVLF